MSGEDKIKHCTEHSGIQSDLCHIKDTNNRVENLLEKIHDTQIVQGVDIVELKGNIKNVETELKGEIQNIKTQSKLLVTVISSISGLFSGLFGGKLL